MHTPSSQQYKYLSAIFQSVRIASPVDFTIAGHPAPPLHVVPQGIPGIPAGANPLAVRLQLQLYERCFCHRLEENPGDLKPPGASRDSLQQELSKANATTSKWEPGWQITHVLPSGQVVAQRYGVVRVFLPGQYVRSDGQAGQPRAGDGINAFFPRESAVTQEGYYFSIGEAVTGLDDDSSLVRFYLSITSSGATTLERLVTQRLNRWLVPFRLKVLTDPAHYSRLDAAVLFLNKRFFHVAAYNLRGLTKELETVFRKESPLFTKPLLPGFSMAEDPGNGESFGLSRCRMLAEAIVNAYSSGLQTEEARMKALNEVFTREGLSLDKPHLNPGSIDYPEFDELLQGTL